MSKNHETNLIKLQAELQKGDPTLLEKLAADLLGRLLKVQILVSKAGFQHGSDAGTAGRQDRHLRIECKRYSQNTPLGERELQGEVDDAVKRDPSLEVWVLVSTRNATEGVQQTLNLKAQSVGVPILVIDWTQPQRGIPDLAALCAWAPDLVERHYSKMAGKAAKALAAIAAPAVERIKRDLEPWHVGFQAIRRAAHERIRTIWTDGSESRALFAQNVAGGAVKRLLRRNTVMAALNNWWVSPTAGPMAVHGAEGVGKTWAVMHWVVDRIDNLPIVLALPSSSLPAITGISEASVIDFLANELFGLTNTQTLSYWDKRLRRLLARPAIEGPVLFLVLDGLNQESTFEWQHLFQVLQGGIFKGKVRVVLTMQTHFLEGKLQGLRQLAGTAVRLGVEPYDMSPGGELDQVLALHGLARTDIQVDLLPLSRFPRLFPLVLKFHTEAAFYGNATVTGLLWAYGRDALGMRDGRAFSDAEWEAWLVELARQHLASINARLASGIGPADTVVYSLKDLSVSAAQSDLEPKHVYRRLSEIIGGTWMEPVPGAANKFRPKAATINLALGAALLGHLEEVSAKRPDQVDFELDRWLDPIVATAVAAEVLAAATSILVAKGLGKGSVIASSVITALLQSQNATEAHRREVMALAPAIATPLLVVVERSDARAQSSARSWALESLRVIASENSEAWDKIYERMVNWVAHVDCPSPQQKAQKDGASKPQTDRLIELIGTDEAGTYRVLGVPLRLDYSQRDDLGDSVPRLLEGKPLVPAMRVLVASSVAKAVGLGGRSSWDGLKWVVLLNEVDRRETVELLATLADIATTLVPEQGVHAELQARVAALLLWLTGDDAMEQRAAQARFSFIQGFHYETDDLANPSRSYFALEQRHATQTLADEGLRWRSRIQRSSDYLPDPNLEIPESFRAVLVEVAERFDVTQLDRFLSHTAEDHDFDKLEPAVGRVAPAALAALVHRKLATLVDRPSESRHWAGVRMSGHLLLIRPEEAAAAFQLRQAKPEPPDKEEAFVSTQLLMAEVLHLPPEEQLDAFVAADPALLTIELLNISQSTTTEGLTQFLERHSIENRRAVQVLFCYLWKHATPLSEEVFERLIPFAFGDDKDSIRTHAFMGLSASNPEQFGRRLLERGWRVDPSQSVFEQDHGSLAVLRASNDKALDALANIVAPWRLLAAARERGSNPSDVKLAASLLDAAISETSFHLGDPGANISADRTHSSRMLRVSVSAKTDTCEDENAIDQIKEAFDSDGQWRKYEEASERATAYLETARKAGANLYTINVQFEDARMLVEHCSAEVNVWLDGMESKSPEFSRKIGLAGGLFLALCEALLVADPQRGVTLWHALADTLQIRYKGLGGVDDLMHMIFRAPNSAQVLALRDELYSMRRNPTDKDLLELVLCATANGKGGWLDQRVSEDENSPHDWRRKRAIVLRGLMALPSIDELSWSEGPVRGSWEGLRHNALLWGNRQSMTRYWWRHFLAADTAEGAYAAWHVFLACADRRAWAWIGEEMERNRSSGTLYRLKMLHFRINRSKLEMAMEEKETKGSNRMDRQLMGWDAPGQWLHLS